MTDTGKFSSACSRWAGIGPYYAMFPAQFSDDVVAEYTKPGEAVLDPFAGRGTAVFSAARQGRVGLGVEINPVGWVYSQAKLYPADQNLVIQRLEHIWKLSRRFEASAAGMPEFYHRCFDDRVLRFLLSARVHLNWRSRRADCTLMALLLVNLHGKRDSALSNQMRQTKSMSPHYAIRWWQSRDLKPPEVDPVEFMLKRIAWRYVKGKPQLHPSQVYLGDSTTVLRHVPHYWGARYTRPQLLLTSPPYRGITNYHYDQWLRLWLLGGPSLPKALVAPHRGKFQDKDSYKSLLLKVFAAARDVLRRNAIIYVRTDKRDASLDVTKQILKQVFPRHHLRQRMQPYKGETQTRLFGHSDPRLGEVDLILVP